MTTMDVPSVGGYLALRIAKLATRRKERNANRVRTMYQTIVRLVLHLAGFSLLTWGGFTFNMLAGLITAGLSCFVLSYLTTTDTDQSADDPMTRR